jgi:dihydrofolate synthase/folylpolyglutamate synthase
MFTRVGPLIDHWYFTDLPTTRAARALDLAATWQSGNQRPEVRFSCHPDPATALQAATAEASPADRICVFGSFFTVGGVLQNGLPRLSARHLQP